jgi:N-acetylglucosaminyldiphosphoundecaprenol N-acetyl-beta-D-mannosaminyltransferase
MIQQERANVLGVGVSPINMHTALETIDEWIKTDAHQYVCVTGVHGVMESQHDEKLRRIHNSAGLVTPDGMPLVWLGRLQGFKHTRRVYGPDLMLALCEHSIAKGYRHYLYGSNPDVLERLAENLTTRFPGLQIVGMFSPPFRALMPDEDDQIISEINSVQPHIIWVGLSTPKQEYWMSEHHGKVNAQVMAGVGAAFDFHAGLKKQAPLWMRNSGLEWLFRLLTEPRRLWQRYLTNNPIFLILILGQLLGFKHYSVDE